MLWNGIRPWLLCLNRALFPVSGICCDNIVEAVEVKEIEKNECLRIGWGNNRHCCCFDNLCNTDFNIWSMRDVVNIETRSIVEREVK